MRSGFALASVVALFVLGGVADLAIDTAFALPVVHPPYLGEFCVDPATDSDLEHCYGLDPFSGMAETVEYVGEWSR
jgi:hypothetical protein